MIKIPPNYRNTNTCSECKFSSYVNGTVHCNKYEVEVYESYVCDDFKEVE